MNGLGGRTRRLDRVAPVLATTPVEPWLGPDMIAAMLQDDGLGRTRDGLSAHDPHDPHAPTARGTGIARQARQRYVLPESILFGRYLPASWRSQCPISTQLCERSSPARIQPAQHRFDVIARICC